MVSVTIPKNRIAVSLPWHGYPQCPALPPRSTPAPMVKLQGAKCNPPARRPAQLLDASGKPCMLQITGFITSA